MATTEVPDADTHSAGNARRKFWWRLFGASAVLLLLAGAAGYAWRWYTTASDLTPYYRINESAPFRIGQTFYVGSDIQPTSPSSGHRTLDVKRVTPDIAVNTANATVDVLLCVVAHPNEGMGTGIDTSPCAAVTRFRPGRIDLGFPATEIIYRVSATRPGTVRIEGAGVSYDDGTRRGDQRAGSGIVLTVSR